MELRTVETVAAAIEYGTALGIKLPRKPPLGAEDAVSASVIAAEREHSLRRHDEGASETRRRAGTGTLSALARSVVVRMSRRAGERMAMVTTAEGRMSRRIGGASGGEATEAAAR